MVKEQSQSAAAPTVELVGPKRPRDSESEAMMAAGSVVLSVGAVLTVVGGGSWYANATAPYLHVELDLIPPTEILCGLVLGTIGATFLGAGVKRHKRWKANLAGPARVQLQPMIGFTQIGVVGRF